MSKKSSLQMNNPRENKALFLLTAIVITGFLMFRSWGWPCIIGFAMGGLSAVSILVLVEEIKSKK